MENHLAGESGAWWEGVYFLVFTEKCFLATQEHEALQATSPGGKPRVTSLHSGLYYNLSPQVSHESYSQNPQNPGLYSILSVKPIFSPSDLKSLP